VWLAPESHGVHVLPYIHIDDMAICMKTTRNISDDLLRSAKQRALERGITLTKVIEDALETALTRQPETRTQYCPEISIRQGTRLPDVDIANRNDLYDLMEMED